MVHLAVAIGHDGEVKADLRQAEGCNVVRLPIPERFHDIEAGAICHRLRGTSYDARDFTFREAIEELAHPNSVCPRGEGGRNVK